MPAGALATTSFGATPPKQNTYPASIAQSAQDYDEIMKRYRGVADTDAANTSGLAAQYQNLINNPQAYVRSPEMGAAFGLSKNLAETGGYSDQGIQDLRARGVSPIRSVYANAMQNVDRQKSLQGGYSPNYTAAMAKMTRDLSESVAGGTQNVNAGIAQNVASNKLSATPQYMGAALNETGMMNDVNARNQATNLGGLNALQGLYGNQNNNQLAATQGMANLYGTTPANPALYGQQAYQSSLLDLQKKQQAQQGNTALMNSYTNLSGRRY